MRMTLVSYEILEQNPKEEVEGLVPDIEFTEFAFVDIVGECGEAFHEFGLKILEFDI